LRSQAYRGAPEGLVDEIDRFTEGSLKHDDETVMML
jgi:hypothetical protein